MKYVLLVLLLNYFILEEVTSRPKSNRRWCRPRLCRRCDLYMNSRRRRSASDPIYEDEMTNIALFAADSNIVRSALKPISESEFLAKSSNGPDEDLPDKRESLSVIDPVDEDPDLQFFDGRRVKKRSSTDLRRFCRSRLRTNCCKGILHSTAYLGFKI